MRKEVVVSAGKHLLEVPPRCIDSLHNPMLILPVPSRVLVLRPSRSLLRPGGFEPNLADHARVGGEGLEERIGVIPPVGETSIEAMVFVGPSDARPVGNVGVYGGR